MTKFKHTITLWKDAGSVIKNSASFAFSKKNDVGILCGELGMIAGGIVFPTMMEVNNLNPSETHWRTLCLIGELLGGFMGGGIAGAAASAFAIMALTILWEGLKAAILTPYNLVKDCAGPAAQPLMTTPQLV